MCKIKLYCHKQSIQNAGWWSYVQLTRLLLDQYLPTLARNLAKPRTTLQNLAHIRVQTMPSTAENILYFGGAAPLSTAAGAGWIVACKVSDIWKPRGPLVASVAAASILTMSSAYLYSQAFPNNVQHKVVRAGGYVSSGGVFCIATCRAGMHLEHAFNAQSWRLAGQAVPAVAGMFVSAACMAACVHA